MTTSSATDGDDEDLLTRIKGRTLLDVSECLSLHPLSPSRGVKFVDGSWFLSPPMDRNARSEFESGPRIAHAIYFDVDDIASKGKELNPKGLPHMMPPKKLFGAYMDAVGIEREDHLIVYGSKDCLFPHRAWFQLRSMGHPPSHVHYMQGSLQDWIDAGGPMDAQPTKVIDADALDLSQTTNYAAVDPQWIASMNDVLQIVSAKGDEKTEAVVVDVRSADRFRGRVEEPRPNMRLGHMPGALNVPFTDLLSTDNVNRFKSLEEMETAMKRAGLDPRTDKRIVCSCGSGATACALALALSALGRDVGGTYVYDGSWSEWGAESDTPIVKD